MRASKSLLVLVAALAACGHDDASTGLHFHGQSALLPGFDGDTGLRPPGSDVQVQLVVRANGTVSADGDADGNASLVVGRAGSGRLAVDGQFLFDGHLKIQISGLPKYDGPIPQLDQVNVSFSGASSFDPFLLGGASARATADIPETKLPEIPLPGGLTGKLLVTVVKGSSVTSELSGTCAGVADGKVTWRAATKTSGKLILKPTIVVKIPIKGDKSFDLPEIPVDIPARDGVLDLGSVEVGEGDAPAGGSAATTAIPGGCGSSPGGDASIDDASVDGPPIGEDGAPPVTGDHQVLCADAGCAVPSDYCCVSDAGESCIDAGFACDGSKLRCDQSGDCASGVCCAVPDPVTFTIEASCRPTCDGAYERKACAADAECGADRCVTEVCRGRLVSLCGGLPAEVELACE
jgi:hypothetical protein